MTEKKKEDSSKGSQTSWRNIHIKHTGKRSMKEVKRFLSLGKRVRILTMFLALMWLDMSCDIILRPKHN